MIETMIVKKAEQVNIETDKIRKPREKKEKPLGYRELMALEAEVREEARQLWLKDVRWVADCYYNYIKEVAVIVIYDTSFFRETARFTIKIDKVETSRVVEIIKKEYRITIERKNFYDINKSSRHIVTQQATIFF